MENPTVTTRSCPSSRAHATAAARSSTSRSPTVDRPPDAPCPRKENVTTAPYRASTRATRRMCGRSASPVNPCATTNTGSGTDRAAPESPSYTTDPLSYTESISTPSAVRKNVRNRVPPLVTSRETECVSEYGLEVDRAT